MAKEKSYGTDYIPEKVHKMMHNVSFAFFALIVGLIVFFAFQLYGVMNKDKLSNYVDEETVSETDENADNDVDLGHNYCGTFFIWQTVDNNYKSLDAYNEYDEKISDYTHSPICSAANILVTSIPFVIIICFFMIFRQADKKRFFEKSGWRYFMAPAIVYLLSSIWSIHFHSRVIAIEREYTIGIFKNQAYYCQIYYSFGIPAMILLTALILRQHTLNTHKQSADGNAKALRVLAGLMGAVGFGFMLVRLGTRVYEIICYKTHDARLPFYYVMLDLPRELAESPDAYRDVLIFRLVKDMPVFIASAITIVMLIKIMLSAAGNRISTPENMKRFNISMIALALSSLLYNVLGIHEVHMISGHFSGIYNIVTYTIGIRSLTDPILYMVFMWWCKTFVSMAAERPTVHTK